MNVKKLIEEIDFRKEGKFENQKVLGAEIKDRRLSMSRTQSALSNSICSISYFSKIENNKITAKESYLKEIFKRLELKDEKINLLLKLDVTLKETIKLFFRGKSLDIQKIITNGVGLVNYRYKIIELIYYISIKDMVRANEIGSRLMRLIGTMSDEDLIIYSVFYAILLFYNQEFEDAYLALKSLDNSHIFLEELTFLQKKYILYLDYLLNKVTFHLDYQKIFQLYIERGFYSEIDELNYVLALYFFQNESYMEYFEVYRIIKNPTFRNSLNLLSKMKFGRKIKWKKEWLKDVRPFFYHLGLLTIDSIEAKSEIEKLNDSCFDYDFNSLILDYLLISSNEEKFDYIKKIVIPSITRTHAYFSKIYFLNEMSKLCKENGKYKSFNEMYREIR